MAHLAEQTDVLNRILGWIRFIGFVVGFWFFVGLGWAVYLTFGSGTTVVYAVIVGVSSMVRASIWFKEQEGWQ